MNCIKSPKCLKHTRRLSIDRLPERIAELVIFEGENANIFSEKAIP